MTNREWMLSLSNEELSRFILFDLPAISKQYASSEQGITEWLAEKNYDGNPVKREFTFAVGYLNGEWHKKHKINGID